MMHSGITSNALGSAGGSPTMNIPSSVEFTIESFGRGLQSVGLRLGQVVLVHSAMRTLGRVEGGVDRIVEALRSTLGPRGTLVAPTFTFKHEIETDPLIDPAADPSEMGIISEAVRRSPDAWRSVAFRHSFAAIGRRARVITEVDPRLSPFDLRSSFGVMLALDAQVLLLGVTYSSSTSHHFCEWLCDVPYRHAFVRPGRVRRRGSQVERVDFVDYQPKPSADGSYYGRQTTDFNRLGRMLEETGKVGIAAVGNAVVRRFALRDLCDLAQAEAEKDYNIFRTKENETGKVTPLKDGEIVIFVLTDGAGRRGKHQLAVVDSSRLSIPVGVTASNLKGSIWVRDLA